MSPCCRGRRTSPRCRADPCTGSPRAPKTTSSSPSSCRSRLRADLAVGVAPHRLLRRLGEIVRTSRRRRRRRASVLGASPRGEGERRAPSPSPRDDVARFAREARVADEPLFARRRGRRPPCAHPAAMSRDSSRVEAPPARRAASPPGSFWRATAAHSARLSRRDRRRPDGRRRSARRARPSSRRRLESSRLLDHSEAGGAWAAVASRRRTRRYTPAHRSAAVSASASGGAAAARASEFALSRTPPRGAGDFDHLRRQRGARTGRAPRPRRRRSRRLAGRDHRRTGTRLRAPKPRRRAELGVAQPSALGRRVAASVGVLEWRRQRSGLGDEGDHRSAPAVRKLWCLAPRSAASSCASRA